MKLIRPLFFIFLFAFTSFTQERFVHPVDEAAKDRSFFTFRTKLIAAAERRDLKYVLGIMDQNITLSFGGHEGVKDFHALWTDKDEFWREFLLVIKNGGAFEAATESSGRMFIAPYTFSKWPESLDAFEHMVVFGANVNLRAGPAIKAKVLDRLSYNIVKVVESKKAPGKEKEEWYRVETLGGKRGWIKAEYLRSPIDHRAGFEKKRGGWKMTYFVAGD